MALRRRLLAAVCAAVLTLGLLVGSAAAADDVYFLSLNDYLAPLSSDLMPVRINNTVYIPSGVFDRTLTGVNLGVYFGQDKATNTATLYSKEKTLIFDINGGYAYDSTQSTYYSSYRAVIRNGRTYVPAFFVCQYFDLEYVALSTDYGVLIRIKSITPWLSDSMFVSSAAQSMRERLEAYLQSQTSSSASATTTSSASPSPTESDRSGVTVYLAMEVTGAGELEQFLDLLDAQWAPVLFFFRPAQLAEYDDLIRRAVGSGHLVGLWPEGDTLEELEEQLSLGNELLERIACRRSYLVLTDGSDSLRRQLSEAGYACWTEHVDGRSNGRGNSALYGAVLEGIEARRTVARVILDDSMALTTFTRLLRQLKADRYDLAAAVETTF